MTALPLLAVLLAPPGFAQVRGPAGGSEIVLTATPRLAGVIHSLTWGGREFIDSHDHGRQLQSAASFDGARPGEFWPECFNPTEAGGRRDGTGPTSTSRLLALSATASTLDTRTRMAFWLPPGERSFGRPALNAVPLSDHVLRKRVTVGLPGEPHAIDYRVWFTVPTGERHTLAQFEVLTGYMPPAFGRFETFDPATGELAPLSDGPGEQPLPVVVSTTDSQHALGAVLTDPLPPGQTGPGYGRFRFAAERVVKWNVVVRVRNPAGVPAGDYPFRVVLAVGTRADVRRTLAALTASRRCTRSARRR